MGAVEHVSRNSEHIDSFLLDPRRVLRLASSIPPGPDGLLVDTIGDTIGVLVDIRWYSCKCINSIASFLLAYTPFLAFLQCSSILA
jgi:hypothetical protein